MSVNKIDRDYNVPILMSNPVILTIFYISTNSKIWILQFYIDFVYPSGKPMIPHLLRCRGFAVNDYSFTLGRLGYGASSTFAQSGWYKLSLFFAAFQSSLIPNFTLKQLNLVKLCQCILQILSNILLRYQIILAHDSSLIS